MIRTAVVAEVLCEVCGRRPVREWETTCHFCRRQEMKAKRMIRLVKARRKGDVR